MEKAVLILILLGVFQGFMQGLMFYNSLAFLDKYLPFGIKWFTRSQNNEKDWYIPAFGKKWYVFGIFPFISFTDFFHLCHLFFGLLIGELVVVGFGVDGLFETIIIFASASILYSTAFELQLRLMKKLQQWN
jgi:hypothetical protein